MAISLSRRKWLAALGSMARWSLAFAVVVAWSNGIAHSAPRQDQAPDTCPKADAGWTAQERFVWARVCAGEQADFNSAPGYGGKLDARSPAGLPDSRVLRPAFLRAILLDDRYRRALKPRGVRISGARFKEPVDLENTEFVHELWIDESLFERGINLQGGRSAGTVTFDDSKIIGLLNFHDSHVGRNLFVRRTVLEDVVFSNFSVAGNVDLGGSRPSGTIWLDGARIGGHLLLNAEAQFAAVDLSGAQLKGQLNLQGSTVTGLFDLEGLQVDGYVLLDRGAKFNEIRLNNGRFGQVLALSGATFTGQADLRNLRVSGQLAMEGVSASTGVLLDGATVGGGLILSRSKITGGGLMLRDVRVEENVFCDDADIFDINLGRAQIKGQLSIRKSRVGGQLDMDGVQVGGHAFLDQGAALNEVILTNARFGGALAFSDTTIAGQVDMSNAAVSGAVDLGRTTISGMLRLNGTQVGGNVLIGKAKLASVDMVAARLKGQLDLGGATVGGRLAMDEVQVDQYSFLDEGAAFNDVSLTSAKLSGLSLSSAKVAGVLDMSSIEIGRDLSARNTSLTEVRLVNAHVIGYVNLRGTTIRDLDADAVTIDGSAFLGNGFQVSDGVNLRSSRIKGDLDLSGGALQGNLDLTNARIERRFMLSGDEKLASGLLTNLSAASFDWGPTPLQVLKTFLGKDPMYVPGLYDQLAKSYTDIGQPDLARSILIAKQDADLRHTKSTTWKVLLFIWWSVSAYGYRPEVGLVWVAIMVGLGAVVFKSGSNTAIAEIAPRSWMLFSLDSVLPVINLDKNHEGVRFPGWRQYFLYFLRLLGAVLVVLVLDYLKEGIAGPK